MFRISSVASFLITKRFDIMAGQVKGVGVLENKHSIATIIFLYRNGPSIKTTIYDNVSRNPRMPDKIDALEEAGLISQESESRVVWVSLTPMGLKVGEHLSAVAELMEGETEE